MTQGKHYDDVHSMRKKSAMLRTAAVSAAMSISKAGKLGERSSIAKLGATRAPQKSAKSALV